jgi:tetratricopeptide (TPR) repeat protein
MALAPELGDSWKAIGMYRYYLLKDYPGALKALAEAGAREPGNSEVLFYMGLIERRQGNWQASLAHLKQAINLDPHNLTLLLTYITTAGLVKDFADAQAAIDRALALAPGNPIAMSDDVRLHLEEGDLDGALARVKDDMLKPGQLDQPAIYALIYDKQYDRARTLVNAALAATDPKDLDVQADWHGVLSDIAYATGDMATVRAESGKALKLHLALRAAGAADVDILGPIAGDYVGMGDREQALAANEKALVLNTGNALDYTQNEVIHAQILARFGDTQAALKLLEYLLKTPGGLNAAEMKLDPSWNSIRKDPGFQALLKKYP